MKIKFSKNDPRAGMVVEMENDRAKALIDSGAAAEEKAEAKQEAPEVKPVAAKPAAKKAK